MTPALPSIEICRWAARCHGASGLCGLAKMPPAPLRDRAPPRSIKSLPQRSAAPAAGFYEEWLAGGSGGVAQPDKPESHNQTGSFPCPLSHRLAPDFAVRCTSEQDAEAKAGCPSARHQLCSGAVAVRLSSPLASPWVRFEAGRPVPANEHLQSAGRERQPHRGAGFFSDFLEFFPEFLPRERRMARPIPSSILGVQNWKPRSIRRRANRAPLQTRPNSDSQIIRRDVSCL